MAIPTINFKGFLYDDAGDAISGATINLYDKNTSTTSRASTTTDSNGAWSIAHTTAGEFDVQITSGSSKRRIKFDDKVHLSELDAETINQLPDSVKILSNFAVGFGNIDLEAAKKRGIAVTNTPEVLSDATAEIGILLI